MAVYADYKTAKEMTEAWGVTRRYVNLCIEDGRIQGAIKKGNLWLIPSGAKKPAGKGGAAKPQNSLPSTLAAIVAATTVPMPKRNPDAILHTVKEERLRLQYRAELAYLRGDFAQVKRCYQSTVGDEAARLRASSIAIAAAISLGDYDFYAEIENNLKGVVEATGNGALSAFAELSLSNAYVSAFAANMVPGWLRDGDFSALPREVLPDAAYKRAKYFQLTRRPEAMLTTAQTALAFCTSSTGLSFHEVYFRAACAMACCALGRAGEARRYLMEALALALPHGFITPFAESVTAFGGLLEHCLQQEYPAYYGAMIAQWEATFTHWRSFHNHFTQNNVTLMLPLRDYQMAQMVANGVPYKRIAEQFNLSLGTLNNRMQVIYETLCITGKHRREELAKYIL